jgi:putative flippase GtrA
MLTAKTRARFLRFFVVGGVGFIVQIGSLALLKSELRPSFAFSVAFALSVATHYSLNRFWALRSVRRDSARQLLEYLATVGVSYLINISVFKFCLHGLGLGVVESGVLAVPPSTLVVFLLLNYRVFRHA